MSQFYLTQSLSCRIACLQLLTIFTKIFLKELNSSEIGIFHFICVELVLIFFQLQRKFKSESKLREFSSCLASVLK